MSIVVANVHGPFAAAVFVACPSEVEREWDVGNRSVHNTRIVQNGASERTIVKPDDRLSRSQSAVLCQEAGPQC